jgi:hypothetical protein
MSLEIGSLPIYLQPLRTAANFGASLGEKFRSVVDFKAKESQIQENQIDILNNSKNQLRLLFTDNESQFNSLSKEQKAALQEMIQMRIEEEENARKHREEIAKQDLIYQANSAAALESAYKATTPDKDKDPVAYACHLEEMRAAVADAVRTEAKSMSTDELKAFASRYSGLDSLVDSREDAIKKLGISFVTAQNMSGHEIAKLQYEKDLKYANIDTEKLATKIDKLSDKDYQGLVREIDRLQKTLIKVSPQTDFGVVDFSDVRERDKERVRNLLDWFESLEIA